MNIPKAIEILQLIIDTPPSGVSPDFIDAQKLGIEALERVKHLRQFWGKDLNLKLLGETKD